MILHNIFLCRYFKVMGICLEIQEQILLPFILRNRGLLPEYWDIDYRMNINSDVKFDSKQYEEDKIDGIKQE